MQTQTVSPDHLFMFSQKVRGLHIHTSTHPHIHWLHIHPPPSISRSCFPACRLFPPVQRNFWFWIQPLIENEHLKLILVHEAVSVDGCCKSDAATRERREERETRREAVIGRETRGGGQERDESRGESAQQEHQEKQWRGRKKLLCIRVFYKLYSEWCGEKYDVSTRRTYLLDAEWCNEWKRKSTKQSSRLFAVCELMHWRASGCVSYKVRLISKTVCDVLPLIVLQVRSSQGLDRPSRKK